MRDLVEEARAVDNVVLTGRSEGELPPPGSEVVRPWKRLPNALSGRLIVAAMWRAIRRRDVDIVHVHFLRWAAEAARAAELSRRPFVLSLHGHDLLVEAPQNDLHWLIRSADKVIVPSPFLAEHATRAGVTAERLHVIPSGIRLDETPPRDRTPRPEAAPLVVFAGRFVEKKGVLDAAETMARATLRTPARCRFVGYGPLEHDLRALCERSGLSVEIVDGRRPGAVRDALSEADVLLSPSRTAGDGDAETLCIVNIEAQAAGVPVISTRSGGIPFAVSERSPILVGEGDVDALTDALVRVLDDPPLRTEMGAAGREFVTAEFDVRARARDVERVYAGVREVGRIDAG